MRFILGDIGMNTPAALRRVAVGLLLLTIGSSVNALVIDFEGKSGNVSGIGAFLDVDGFRFTITGGNVNGFELVTNQSNIVEPNTTKLFAANHTEITMSKVGGGAFDLNSVDIGGSFVSSPNRWADHVDVIAGAVVTATLAGQPPNYVHLNPNFLNVTSVIFKPFVNTNQGANNFEFTIDNIAISETVPEASTLALLALGLAGIGFRRRVP